METEPNPLDSEGVRNAFVENLRWKLLPLAFAAVGVLVYALVEIPDAVVRPFALKFGTAITATVSSKRISTGRRTAGHYVEVNYEATRDFAPRVEIKVLGDLYDSVKVGDPIAVHFVPACPSFCVALDEDRGSARQQATVFGAFAAVILLYACVRGWGKARGARP